MSTRKDELGVATVGVQLLALGLIRELIVT